MVCFVRRMLGDQLKERENFAAHKLEAAKGNRLDSKIEINYVNAACGQACGCSLRNAWLSCYSV